MAGGGMEGFDYLYAVGAQDAADATGDGFVFTPAQPIDVIRFGFIADSLVDVGAGMVVALDHRAVAGSDSVRPAILTITHAADVAAGDGIYVQAAAPIEVNPGEQLVVAVDNAADTGGTFIPFIVYQRRPFVGTRIANLTDVSA